MSFDHGGAACLLMAANICLHTLAVVSGRRELDVTWVWVIGG